MFDFVSRTMYDERHVKRCLPKDGTINAARRPFRARGYLGTALSDVVSESAAAPRGSIYLTTP